MSLAGQILDGRRRETAAIVLNHQLQTTGCRVPGQAQIDLVRDGMVRHVRQGFLRHPVEVHGNFLRQRAQRCIGGQVELNGHAMLR